MNTTKHLLRGKPIVFTGARVFAVTANTHDGQTESALIAADDEQTARTRLMTIQDTIRLTGQVVNYRTIPIK